MNTQFQNTLALVGRLLIAVLFVPAGFGKLTHFSGAVGYINSVGLPLPEVGAALAVFCELIVGLALAVGLFTRGAAAILAVFTLAAAIFFHNYWAAPEAMRMMQQINFFKNIAIVGGLLSIVAWGAGAFSVDAKRGR